MSTAISTENEPSVLAELGAEPATDPAVLNIADIQNAIRVIDHAADQGAFRGWNIIEQVLAVRNRMNAFLKAVTPSAAEPASALPSGTPPSGTQAGGLLVPGMVPPGMMAAAGSSAAAAAA